MGIMLRVHRTVPQGGLGEMTRRKREITGLANEQDFPHLVELALPPGGFRSVFLEIDTFHRERRIPRPPRPESARRQAILYSILLPRRRHCGCIPQSLRWRVLDPRTGQAQAAYLGYVVGVRPGLPVQGRKTPRRNRGGDWRQKRRTDCSLRPCVALSE